MTKARDGISLHEAIKALLMKQNPMKICEIAKKVNYTKKDYSEIKPSQIRARISHHPELFYIINGLVYLR